METLEAQENEEDQPSLSLLKLSSQEEDSIEAQIREEMEAQERLLRERQRIMELDAQIGILRCLKENYFYEEFMAMPNKFELYGKYYNKEDSLSFKLDKELLISVLKDITLNLEEISKQSSKIVEVEESFETKKRKEELKLGILKCLGENYFY